MSQPAGTPNGTLPPIRACLFDMDGLLIDSEDKYTESVNVVLRKYNRPLMPWSIKSQLQGRPGPAAGEIFMAWAQLPIERDEFLTLQSAEQRKLFPTVKPLPGVTELLTTLRGLDPAQRESSTNSSQGVYIALATSSHAGNYALKTSHLTELFDVFPPRSRVLGDDPRVPRGRGKPCPDIYLLALETVNAGIRERNAAREGSAEAEIEVRPDECLVFEDSVPGVEAGRRAGMQVVWVPHPGLLQEYSGREAEVLAGRSGMVGQEQGEDMAWPPPGEVGDAWARRLESLEGFPYESYGIRM